MERGCQRNDSLANGYPRLQDLPECPGGVSETVDEAARSPAIMHGRSILEASLEASLGAIAPSCVCDHTHNNSKQGRCLAAGND